MSEFSELAFLSSPLGHNFPLYRDECVFVMNGLTETVKSKIQAFSKNSRDDLTKAKFVQEATALLCKRIDDIVARCMKFEEERARRIKGE